MAITIGQKLRRIREAAGLTQSSVAQHFAVDKSTVYRWERGSVQVDIDQITRFVAFCGFNNEVSKWIAFGGPQPKSVATKTKHERAAS
jgi:transcriptional regulator with XRE-family HTH domain